MKKLVYCIILTLLLILNTNFAAKAETNTPPTASADSVVLMDAKTGTILYSKNPDSAYPPASTTKTMTALLTLENTQLTDQVVIGKNPPAEEGSAMGLKEGEILTVRDLLYGLMLESGNDCADALAEHIAGSNEKFAVMMNDRAKQLGATNTNFVNPHGLYDSNHKTSAKDLALIMKELIKHPDYRTIAISPSYKVAPTNKLAKERTINNGNKMVVKGQAEYYKDAIAGKTGYTIQSKHSYVAVAERNGQTLIVALVHDSVKTFFKDAPKLFEYGFNNFETKQLFSKGDKLSSVNINDQVELPLLASEDFYYVCEKNSTDSPKISVVEPNINTSKSISRGDPITNASITFKNANLDNVELTSGIDFTSKSASVLSINALESSNLPKVNVLKYIFLGTFSLLILSIAFLLITKKSRRRKRRKKYHEMLLKNNPKDI
jgi:D-alanyl-D-alanine carboxypeptidase